MQRCGRLALGGLAGLLVLVAGCGPRLNQEKTLQVGPDEARGLFIPAVKKERKVTVTFQSADAEVDVYLIEVKNSKKAEEEIYKLVIDKNVGKIVDKKMKSKEGS